MSTERTIRLESIAAFRSLQESAIDASRPAAGTRRVRVCHGGGCIASGACELREALQAAADRAGVQVSIEPSGCMGPCAAGPVVMVDPEGVFYEGVRPEDAADIVERHLVGGTPVSRLLHRNRVDGEIAAVAADVDLFESQTRIVLRNCGTVNPEEILSAVGAGAYDGLVTILQSRLPEEVVETIVASGLRGRGGGGFPTGRKWAATAAAPGDEKYVLCNADEGDPGAFMDRSLLEGDPHTIIEGMTIAGYAVGASRGYVYVRAEYPLAVERLQRAIDQARDLGLLGDHILGTHVSFDLAIRMGSGAFVCGEETALINSIEGKRGEPRPKTSLSR